ncbi:rho guanine nucleotide exchange factor 25-like [Musca autumnalis]|uniref:rho guanine nucleotide exchange factor 25-like n=1 Tax=Musca autumnalis TaxID=221902 RepID=UPI003CF88A53
MTTRSQRRSTSLRKLETTLSELVQEEKVYVEHLSYIVEGYLQEFRKTTPVIKIPDDLRDSRFRIIFCNIESIFHWHRDFFLKTLSHYRHATSELGRVILKFDADFQMYAKYCNNLPIAQCILKQHTEYFRAVQEKLKLKWELSFLLKLPVHRLVQYESLIWKLTDNLREADTDWESMEIAHQMIVKVQKHIYEFGALGGMKNFKGDIYDHGKLLFHEYLHCKYDGKKRRHYVFLFTRLLVFTDRKKPKDKNGTPCYEYCLQIPMNKVQMQVLSKREFSLKTTDSKYIFTPIICQGPSEEVHHLWFMQLQDQLQMQSEFIAFLENPTEETKEKMQYMKKCGNM